MSRKMPDLSNFSQYAAEGGASPKGIAPRPGQIVCGDIDMCIDRNGIWYYHGSPIGRKELVKLFTTVLRRDEAGAYWLITPAEMARITVEDAPFLAVELSTIGEGSDQAISLRTNIDKIVNVDGDHPLRVLLCHRSATALPPLTRSPVLLLSLNYFFETILKLLKNVVLML